MHHLQVHNLPDNCKCSFLQCWCICGSSCDYLEMCIRCNLRGKKFHFHVLLLNTPHKHKWIAIWTLHGQSSCYLPFALTNTLATFTGRDKSITTTCALISIVLAAVVHTNRMWGTVTEFTTSSLVHFTWIPTKELWALTRPLVISIAVKLHSLQRIPILCAIPSIEALAQEDGNVSCFWFSHAVIGKDLEGGIRVRCSVVCPRHFQSVCSRQRASESSWWLLKRSRGETFWYGFIV